MMIATALMAGVAVYSGKQAAQRGDSLAARGVEYHKKLREQAVTEKEAASTKSAQWYNTMLEVLLWFLL